MAHYCVHCGEDLPDSSGICRSCGRRSGQPAEQLPLDKKKAVEYYEKARSLLGLGELDAAIRSLEDALKLNKDHYDSHCLLALICGNKGDSGKAVQHYKVAMGIDPSRQIAYYGMGNLYESQGKFNEAVDLYKKAAHSNPEFTDAYAAIGNIYYEQDKCDDAIEYLKKTIDLKPDHTQAHFLLGSCYIKSRNKGLAVKEMEYLRQNSPDLADILETEINNATE